MRKRGGKRETEHAVDPRLSRGSTVPNPGSTRAGISGGVRSGVGDGARDDGGEEAMKSVKGRRQSNVTVGRSCNSQNAKACENRRARRRAAGAHAKIIDGVGLSTAVASGDENCTIPQGTISPLHPPHAKG